MKKRDKEKTRQVILDTALDKFAEKGFNGASISQISKAAQVNQALIYYYFENKQAILDEILDSFINKANSFLIEIAINNYEFGSPEMENQMLKYNKHFFENEKKLRLLLSESLKDNDGIPPIFKLIDIQMEGLNEEVIIQQMNEKGFNFDKEVQQRKVTEFFTGIMPAIVYSLFREKWSRHFNVNKDDLDLMFKKAEEITH